MNWINEPGNNVISPRCETGCQFIDPCNTYDYGGNVCALEWCSSKVCPTLVCHVYNGS